MTYERLEVLELLHSRFEDWHRPRVVVRDDLSDVLHDRDIRHWRRLIPQLIGDAVLDVTQFRVASVEGHGVVTVGRRVQAGGLGALCLVGARVDVHDDGRFSRLRRRSANRFGRHRCWGLHASKGSEAEATGEAIREFGEGGGNSDGWESALGNVQCEVRVAGFPRKRMLIGWCPYFGGYRRAGGWLGAGGSGWRGVWRWDVFRFVETVGGSIGSMEWAGSSSIWPVGDRLKVGTAQRLSFGKP